MYENIKLIVADIDSTLKPKGDITKRTIDTIEKLRDKGFLIGLASGRPYEDIYNMYQKWSMRNQFDFLICWNGGQLFDNKTQKVYKYNYLTKEQLKEIVWFMLPYDTTISMYKPGIYLCNKKTEKSTFSAWKLNREYVLTDNISEFYDGDNGGIMFRSTPELTNRIEKELANQLKGKEYIMFKTQEDLLEFSNKECNKGFALKKYCDLYNISLDDCLAFGDTTNDNEMLKCCHGVCLLNGSDDTKACAEKITDLDCEHEGWADFIDKYIFKIKEK